MSQLKKIIYNCKQATFLIEKKLIYKLTFREGIELRIHLYGCSVCKLFDKQSHMLNAMVKQLFSNSTHTETRLDDNFKQDLQNLIEEELNKN